MNKLTEYLKSTIAPKSTAVSYAIMQHGQLVASDAIGVINQKDNQPITTNCTFNVASISKIYVTVAIMQLVEQEKITLDTPVYQILPDFIMKDERYKDITVHMLLDHSCALPGTQWKHFSLSKLDGVDYYQEVYHYLSTHHLKANPGEISVYCNDGFTVAEMVVAKVSGMSYEEYVMKYITEPIGAHSTRLSPTINPEYPLVTEGKKPQELLWIMGAAGITTTMEDLCKFGQLFLSENEIISEKSKEIMAQHWGKTFLKFDQETDNYGLGWDQVAVNLPDYDLGEHVVTKGGNSFYFFSRLYVIPKYDAVLAISATHDTKINPADEIIRMFDYYMSENGLPVSNTERISEEDKKKYGGIYYVNGIAKKVSFYGSLMVTYMMDEDRNWIKEDYYLLKEGMWTNQKNEKYFFEEAPNGIYMIQKLYDMQYPEVMKPAYIPQINEAWKKRNGKHYIVCDATLYDIVIAQMLAAVTIGIMEDGVIDIYAHYRKDEPDNWPMRLPVFAVNDQRAEGFLDIPCNGSRDMVDPEFIVEDGQEYLEMASYHYICTDDIKEYNGETFPTGKYNGVYHVTDLKELIPVTENHRIMLVNEDFSFYYDSMDQKEFKPLEKGYIILV